VILETNEHAFRRLGDEISDETLLPRLCVHVEYTEPGDRRAGLGAVLGPEQLVAAAHQERCGTPVHRGRHGFAVLALEIGADDVLPLVLTAAEEEQVGPRWIERHPCGVRADLDADVAPASTLRERDDVAAIAVDAHEIGVEVRDA